MSPPRESLASAYEGAYGALDDVTQTQLKSITDEAIARWEATGLSDAQSDRLQLVTVAIADLEGTYLGLSTGHGCPNR